MKDVLYQIDNPSKAPVIKFQTILSRNGNPLALFLQPASGARSAILDLRRREEGHTSRLESNTI